MLNCVYDMERHHHFMYELCICHWVYTSKFISIVLVLHKNVSSTWVFSLHKCALNDEDSLFPVRPQESFNNPTKWYCKLRFGTSIWKSFDGIEEQVRNLSRFLLTWMAIADKKWLCLLASRIGMLVVESQDECQLPLPLHPYAVNQLPENSVFNLVHCLVH